MFLFYFFIVKVASIQFCLFTGSNLPVLKTQARLQTDIKATKTVAITVAAYFFSYVPAIVYAVGGQRQESQADSWFAFIAWNATFFSSTVNPIIYYLRTSRFRSAFKQLLKDPFGLSDFREKPSGQGNGKQNQALEGAGITKKNGDEEANGSGSQEKYHGERKNGIMVLSIKALQAHFCVLEAGQCNTDVRGKLPRREAFNSISAAPSGLDNASLFSPVIEREEIWTKRQTVVKRKSCQATAAEIKDENEEVSTKSEVKNETKKRKRPSSGEKDHQPENIDSRKTRHQAEGKGEISNKNGLENEPTKGKNLACVENKKMVMSKTEPCEEKGAAKQEEYEEFSKKSGLKNEFPNGKLPFSRKKANSLEINKSGKTETKLKRKLKKSSFTTESWKQTKSK